MHGRTSRRQICGHAEEMVVNMRMPYRNTLQPETLYTNENEEGRMQRVNCRIHSGEQQRAAQNETRMRNSSYIQSIAHPTAATNCGVPKHESKACTIHVKPPVRTTHGAFTATVPRLQWLSIDPSSNGRICVRYRDELQ